MAEGLAFALFSKVSNAAVKREAKRRQLLKDRPLYHRRSAPTGQNRPSGERRRYLSASEDIERIAACRILSTSSSLDMDNSSGRHSLLSPHSGTPPSGDSSDEEDHAHEALMETQTTPVDNEDTTYRLVDRDVIEPNGVGLNFVSQPQPNFVSVRITFMTPDDKDRSSVKTMHVRVRSTPSDAAPEAYHYPPADEFVFDATAEDLTLYCAAKAKIPSRFLPLFALFSVDKGLWLSPDYQLGKLAFQTDYVDLEFRVRLALRPPLGSSQASKTLSYADVSKCCDVVREYVYYQLKEDFTEGKIVGTADIEDGGHGDGTTLCEMVTSKNRPNRTSKKGKTPNFGAGNANSSVKYRCRCLGPATFSLYLDKPPNASIDEYLRRVTNKHINKHLPPFRSLLAEWQWKLVGPNAKSLIQQGFVIIEEQKLKQKDIQLNYIQKIMSLCNPFEEKFVYHLPSTASNFASLDLEDDDDDDSDVLVKLKATDGYPIIVLNKEYKEIPIMDILRVEVSDGKVDLIMNPEVIPLAFDNPLRAESFAALINSYALLSPRHDRFFALCFKGSPGSSRYFNSLHAVKCLVAEAKNEMRHLFHAAGHDKDGFLVIEDADRVGHLHIQKLQPSEGNPDQLRIAVVATIEYCPQVGRWRCSLKPDGDFHDHELRSILNNVLKEVGGYSRNIAPLRNTHRLSSLYSGPPSAGNAQAVAKIFSELEVSGGSSIEERPGYSVKSLSLDKAKADQEVVIKSGKIRAINQETLSRVQNITDWSLSGRCPETLLRTYGHCLNPLTLVLEMAAAKPPLEQWMTRLLKTARADVLFLAPSTTSICDQVGRALHFLASRGIPHGNVTADNVVVTASNESEFYHFLTLPSGALKFNPDIRVKLGDPVFRPTDSEWPSQMARTPPELWSAEDGKVSWTKAADVWAFGTLMWEIFSFRAISLRDVQPAGGRPIRSKSEATEFLKSHNLPPPKPPNDEFQDLWHRAYQIMEVCWTRDADSRPRMSVIFEAQWQFLNQREPEDMKNFQNFIENSRELPGPPIPFGDFQCDDESDDEIIRISHDDEPDRAYFVETPDGDRQFREIRQKPTKSVLGEGHFGKVFRGEIHFSKDEVRDCAVKTFHHNRNQDGNQIMNDDEILKEMRIGLKIPKHANVIELIAAYRDDRPFAVRYLILMELMDGSLAKRLETAKAAKNMDTNLQMYILHEISRGMAHLHEHNVLHRDLAVRNVMLKEGSGKLIVKVGDFGLARTPRTPESSYYARNDRRSAIPLHMYPPETLQSETYKFHPEGDVWSFGQLVLEVCSPHPTNIQKEFKKIGGEDGVIAKRRFPDLDCPKRVYEGLVLRCMEYEREKRPLFYSKNRDRPTVENLVDDIKKSLVDDAARPSKT